jgi:AcrR family transcriptional regulator
MSGIIYDMVGLRARKKLETRQHISDVATSLFVQRGFDAVTVAEIAQVANVSKMTVFNYFPRKEDLLFDRGPELADLLTRTIRDRQPDETPLAALRRVLLGLIDEGHPLAAVGDTFPIFWRVVLDSPVLQARAREAVDEVEGLLAGLLAEATDAPPDDPRPQLLAALAVAAYRTAYVITARRLLAGERADDVRAAHAALVGRAFSALERVVEVC